MVGILAMQNTGQRPILSRDGKWGRKESNEAQKLIHLRGITAACSNSKALILSIGKIGRKETLSRHT